MNIDIIHGDCLDYLKQFPDNFIDSIVTDPPYGLSFMNKKWDYDVPSIEIWKEALRVLKPGGHLLSFGGTRTYHRMVMNIEDAGFEIRDQIMWLYGCLSEDTEILTINGWEHYHKDIINSPVVCYNYISNTFEIHKPTKEFIYENKHTCYRIKSDFTDQIVSRNHRVLVESEGNPIFKFAETCKSEENIPFLESLSDLPETIYDFQSYTSLKKQELLQRVLKQKNISSEQRKKTIKNNMFSLWKRILSNRTKHQKTKKSMFQTLQWYFKRSGLEKTCSQGKDSLETRIRTSFDRENDRKYQSSMERGSNLFQEKGKLYRSKVYKMSTRIFGNGSERWLHNGTQTNNGSEFGKIINKIRSCTPFRPQSIQQQNREFDVIQEQLRTQKIRSTKAEIKEIEYNGKVWCVEVPTGAFVARRNGKIFITGNSGFPKSMDISKAINKMAGAEREIIGKRLNGVGSDSGSSCYEMNNGNSKMSKEIDITVPATPEAKQWDGWGTALKPANEPICLARKPLSEKTIAENVLKWGTGGINIDDCRIEYIGHVDPRTFGGKWKTNKMANDVYEGGYKGKDQSVSTEGRFPANVILDEKAAEMLDEQVPYTSQPCGSKKKTTHKDGMFGIGQPGEIYKDDSNGASRFFYCAKASKKERNQGLEDFEAKKVSDGRQIEADNAFQRGKTERKNTHPTVKPIKLMQYLITLITPPNGIVLDPFTGSGSTGLACKELGNFHFIGIEMNPEYVEIAKARLERGIK